MKDFVNHIPILTTIFAAGFFVVILRHWLTKKHATYLLWWTIGVFTYGLGTLTESITTVFGWSLFVFKSWYISGALLGGYPLAQGTVYLLMRRSTAHGLTALTLAFVCVGAICVTLSPVNESLVEANRLSGKVLEWRWVRLFSPFINLYSAVFLIGGALYSAAVYHRARASGVRVWGNVLIAIGALLPGIGGSFTRFGYTEVLYVTELIGLWLIFAGYISIRRDRSMPAVTSGESLRPPVSTAVDTVANRH
jgi:hypothetical protein